MGGTVEKEAVRASGGFHESQNVKHQEWWWMSSMFSVCADATVLPSRQTQDSPLFIKTATVPSS